MITRLIVRFPRGQQACVARCFWRRDQLANGFIKYAFMHPAPGKSVERQYIPDNGVIRQMVAPARQLCMLKSCRTRRTRLVEQNHHRLGQPLQYFHLGCQIAGVTGVLG